MEGQSGARAQGWPSGRQEGFCNVLWDKGKGKAAIFQQQLTVLRERRRKGTSMEEPLYCEVQTQEKHTGLGAVGPGFKFQLWHYQ